MPLWLVGFGGWLKGVPAWIWGVVAIVAAALVGIYIVDHNAVVRTRRKEEAKALKDTIELQNTAEEITDGIADRVEQADEAVARLPELRSTSELRRHDPELADLILGPEGDDR